MLLHFSEILYICTELEYHQWIHYLQCCCAILASVLFSISYCEFIQEICFSYITADQSDVFNGLSLNAQNTCEKVMQIYAGMCLSIYSGNITAEELHKLQEKADTFGALLQFGARCMLPDEAQGT